MKAFKRHSERGKSPTQWAEAAKAFAEALRRAPEWQEWQEARVAFEADREVANLLDQHRALTARWRQARSRGHALYGKDATELAEVTAKLEQNAVFRRHRDASQRLLQGLRQTNEALTSALGIDFAASTAPRATGGCCG